MTPPLVPCPGCSAPMGLDEEVCSACRRPRDAWEIEKGKTDLAAAVERARRRPYRLAAGALALLAFAGAYRARAPLVEAMRSERESLAAGLAAAQDPARRPGGAAPRTEMGARLVAVLSPLRARDGVVPPAAGAAPAAASPAPAPPSAAPRRAVLWTDPGPRTTNLRRIYGLVYELDTGNAVAGADVSLSVPGSGLPATATTDADGRWMMTVNRSVPDDGRCAFTVTRGGKPLRAVADSDPPYLERTPAMLRQDLEALALHEEAPVVLEYDGEREDDLRRNLVVLPAGFPAAR